MRNGAPWYRFVRKQGSRERSSFERARGVNRSPYRDRRGRGPSPHRSSHFARGNDHGDAEQRRYQPPRDPCSGASTVDHVAVGVDLHVWVECLHRAVGSLAAEAVYADVQTANPNRWVLRCRPTRRADQYWSASSARSTAGGRIRSGSGSFRFRVPPQRSPSSIPMPRRVLTSSASSPDMIASPNCSASLWSFSRSARPVPAQRT